MDNFQIETAQNVTINQNVAGLLDRLLAFTLDALIMAAYSIIVFFILINVDSAKGNDLLFYFTIGLPLFLYHLLWETFWNGQSPGKAVLKIRVVKIDGSRPAFSNYILRWVLRTIDIALSFGSVAIVTLLFNGKGQRLGDLAATTTVISEKPTTTIQTLKFVNLPDNYTPKYPQVTVFKDDEIQTIKSIFYDAKSFGKHHIIIRLAIKTSKVMGVDFDEKPIEFIDKVITDYSFYTQE